MFEFEFESVYVFAHSVVAHIVALPLIEIAFSTLDCSIVPTCGAWGSATAAKRGPLKQSWVGIQHSRDDDADAKR